MAGLFKSRSLVASCCEICHEDIVDSTTDETTTKCFSCSHAVHLKCFSDYLYDQQLCPTCCGTLQEEASGEHWSPGDRRFFSLPSSGKAMVHSELLLAADLHMTFDERTREEDDPDGAELNLLIENEDDMIFQDLVSVAVAEGGELEVVEEDQDGAHSEFHLLINPFSRQNAVCIDLVLTHLQFSRLPIDGAESTIPNFSVLQSPFFALPSPLFDPVDDGEAYSEDHIS